MASKDRQRNIRLAKRKDRQASIKEVRFGIRNRGEQLKSSRTELTVEQRRHTGRQSRTSKKRCLKNHD